jgi:two-component system, OmpR family, KDP operon response regulator KdpE
MRRARGSPQPVRAYAHGVPNVLLIEDDPRIRQSLTRALNERGYAVESVASGLAGVQECVHRPPQLVLLDLGLPDLDGTDVLRMLRAVSAVPIIVVTARDDDRAVVLALDAGADDYIIKPFTTAQLEARVRAVLRRSGAIEPSAPLTVGDLLIDLAGRTATLRGQELDLRPREFDLLAYLAARQGQVVSRRELLAEVWNLAYGGADKTVDVHLSWLRRKLGESADAPEYLHTVRGVGIKLKAP